MDILAKLSTVAENYALTHLDKPLKSYAFLKSGYKTKDFCIWMFSMEDKKAIVNDVFEKFHDRFGFYPESVSYTHLDVYKRQRYRYNVTW